MGLMLFYSLFYMMKLKKSTHSHMHTSKISSYDPKFSKRGAKKLIEKKASLQVYTENCNGLRFSSTDEYLSIRNWYVSGCSSILIAIFFINLMFAIAAMGAGALNVNEKWIICCFSFGNQKDHKFSNHIYSIGMFPGMKQCTHPMF